MYIYIYIYKVFKIKNINFSVKYFDVCLFQLRDLQYEILQKCNYLQEPFVTNIFPLDILNHERNQ